MESMSANMREVLDRMLLWTRKSTVLVARMRLPSSNHRSGCGDFFVRGRLSIASSLVRRLFVVLLVGSGALAAAMVVVAVQWVARDATRLG